MDCDFCLEAKGGISATVHRNYPELRSRTIYRSESLFAVPTVGQLFANSLLLVSNEHIERFSDAPGLQPEVQAALSELAEIVSAFGKPLIYEHGARCAGSGGCGIYHAHAHIVPLPYQISLRDLVGRSGSMHTSLAGAWQMASPDEDYLVAAFGGETLFCKGGDVGFGSQFMRKRVAEEYRLDRPWDWRAYVTREADFERSLKNFEMAL
jgi:diadenosine tetraphosphate (Ap4A) HIT family hydrolase